MGVSLYDELSPIAIEAARHYGIPVDVYLRLITQESGWDSDVVYGRRASSAGAQGAAQFMPATAAGLGIDPLNPIQALWGGAQYLRQQIDYFGGDIVAGTAAYNAGAGNVERAMARGGARWTAYLPEETQAYLAIIRPGQADNAGPETIRQTQVSGQERNMGDPEEDPNKDLDERINKALGGGTNKDAYRRFTQNASIVQDTTTNQFYRLVSANRLDPFTGAETADTRMVPISPAQAQAELARSAMPVSGEFKPSNLPGVFINPNSGAPFVPPERTAQDPRVAESELAFTNARIREIDANVASSRDNLQLATRRQDWAEVSYWQSRLDNLAQEKATLEFGREKLYSDLGFGREKLAVEVSEAAKDRDLRLQIAQMENQDRLSPEAKRAQTALLAGFNFGPGAPGVAVFAPGEDNPLIKNSRGGVEMAGNVGGGGLAGAVGGGAGNTRTQLQVETERQLAALQPVLTGNQIFQGPVSPTFAAGLGADFVAQAQLGQQAQLAGLAGGPASRNPLARQQAQSIMAGAQGAVPGSQTTLPADFTAQKVGANFGLQGGQLTPEEFLRLHKLKPLDDGEEGAA